MRNSGRIWIFAFDGVDFFRRNFARFLSFFFFVALGLIIGVWYGSSVGDEVILIWRFDNRLVAVITKSAGFASHLFWLILECSFVIALIVILSLNYYAMHLSYLIFVYRGYLLGFNIVILFISAKLSCLPFVLLCYLPFGLASIFLLTCIAVKAFTLSHYGFAARCLPRPSEILSPCIPVLIVTALLCFFQTILTFLLTSGIIIAAAS